jgi:putative transcriptional regulator
MDLSVAPESVKATEHQAQYANSSRGGKSLRRQLDGLLAPKPSLTNFQRHSWHRSSKEWKMPSDIQQLQNDVLESVRQIRKGKAARVTQVKLSAAAEARAQCGLSQHEFAALLGVSPRTLQDWEQGRREPTGVAKTLLRVAAAHPDVLRDLRD